jgi:hypothetical protein
VDCSIHILSKFKYPLKKNGWNFNWRIATKNYPNTTYCLIDHKYQQIQGAIQLRIIDGMLIMEIIELAPENIGSKRKFQNVAGCLIAFACKEAIKLKTEYKGYLTFVAKTELIELYKQKYNATQTIGHRMYIDPFNGEKLIIKYLENED